MYTHCLILSHIFTYIHTHIHAHSYLYIFTCTFITRSAHTYSYAWPYTFPFEITCANTFKLAYTYAHAYVHICTNNLTIHSCACMLLRNIEAAVHTQSTCVQTSWWFPEDSSSRSCSWRLPEGDSRSVAPSHLSLIHFCSNFYLCLAAQT